MPNHRDSDEPETTPIPTVADILNSDFPIDPGPTPALPDHKKEDSEASDPDDLDTDLGEGSENEDLQEPGLPFPLRVLIGSGLFVLILGLALALTRQEPDDIRVRTFAAPAVESTTTTDASTAPASTLEPTTTSTESPNDVEAPPPTAAPVPAASDTPAPGIPNRVTFEDNFTSLNTDVWAVENVSSFGDGNNEVQCYLDNNTRVENGRLILTARQQSVQCENDRRQFTSGMVRSKGIEFKPGQAIEFRVKLTPGNEQFQGGLWPALWASSFGGGGWPLGGELDFFEVMTARNPKRVIFSMHFKNQQNQNDKIQKEIFSENNFSDDWHTFRFDYGQRGVLVWYMDGEEVQRVTDAPTRQGYPEPFNATIKQLRINLALGGNPGPLDARAVSGAGATYEIDYIRIFDL